MEDWLNGVAEEDREKAERAYADAGTLEAKVRVLSQWHPRGYVNLDPIKNLEEYFKYVRLTANESTWFRGESRDHGHLIPKLYRGIDDVERTKQQAKEQEFLLEFRRRARTLAPSIQPDDIWSWYFLIQHYGGQTRLLDWTQDAAIALFFALDTHRDAAQDPIVIELQPTTLIGYAFAETGDKAPGTAAVLYPGETPTDKWITNLTEPKGHPSIGIPDWPIPLLPPYSDPRIASQKSCFTLFGNRIHGFYKDSKPILCSCCGQRVIRMLVIDGRATGSLRSELKRIGIASGRVYPGLDGLSKELEDEIFPGDEKSRTRKRTIDGALAPGQQLLIE